jgi:hypothetical protein
LYGYALIDKNIRSKKLISKTCRSNGLWQLINMSIKFIGGRSRPFYTDTPFEFNPFKTNFEQTSFASGHSTLAFAYSTVMAKEYQNFFWKFGWYSLQF